MLAFDLMVEPFVGYLPLSTMGSSHPQVSGLQSSPATLRIGQSGEIGELPDAVDNLQAVSDSWSPWHGSVDGQGEGSVAARCLSCFYVCVFCLCWEKYKERLDEEELDQEESN